MVVGPRDSRQRDVGCWNMLEYLKYVDVPLPLSDATGAKSYLHTQLFSHKKQQLQAEKRASISSFRHFQPSLLHLQSNLLPPSSHTRKLMVLYVATNTPSRRQHCPTSMMGSTAKTCWKTVTSLDHVPLLLGEQLGPNQNIPC